MTRDFSRGRSTERALGPFDSSVCSKSLQRCAVVVGFEGNYKSTPGGVLPYMGYIGMCRCEGYGFQAVYSRTGYIN